MKTFFPNTNCSQCSSQVPSMITRGTILQVDRKNRNFTTIQGSNQNTIIQFNVPENATIINRYGRPIAFSRLKPGMHVWVRHANFMTNSIPPQTTAFEIRVR